MTSGKLSALFEMSSQIGLSGYSADFILGFFLGFYKTPDGHRDILVKHMRVSHCALDVAVVHCLQHKPQIGTVAQLRSGVVPVAMEAEILHTFQRRNATAPHVTSRATT